MTAFGDLLSDYDEGKGGAAPPAAPGQRSFSDLLDQYDAGNTEAFKPRESSSATGAFGRGALRNIIPGLGSIPAIGAGAELGAAAGAPLAPFTLGLSVPVGGIIGGLAGGYFGAQALSTAQDWVLSKAPDSWREAIGLDGRQEKLDAAAHPYASFLGGLAPYAVTMRPGGFAKAATRENATALERIMAHPVTARLFGGAAMGGIELGQEEIHDGTPDWAKVAVSTGFGLVFNKPTRIGEAITEFGARPARRLLGLPEPTTADAADLGVMGPGRTEETFRGSHETDPAAVASAAETKRIEQSVIGPDPQPDVHAVARRIAPDLFAHYDELQTRADALRRDEANAGHLAATRKEIAEIEPQVAAAYRRAAEHAGAPTIEPPAAEVPLAPPLPSVKPEPIRPIEGSPNPGASRVEAARTGDPVIDGVLNIPIVRAVIENPVIDRSHTVGNSWGGSLPFENPTTYIDHEFPRTETVDGVTFDTGEPAAVHENAEAYVLKVLMDAGMDRATALKSAFWGWGERAEDAWYRFHGLDPKKIEARWNPILDRIARRRAGNVPSDLFKETYPDGDPQKASPGPIDKPTAEEMARARQIVQAHLEQLPTATEGGAAEGLTPPAAPAVSPAEAAPPSTFIRDDVARQMTRAGRPTEEAQAAGSVISAHYRAIAAWFRGALGTAEDIYRDYGAEILGSGMRSAQAKGIPQPRGPRKADEEKLTLLQFLAHRGGLARTADLESILDKNPFVPGFGRMFRQGGMSMDRAREAAVEAGYIQEEGQQRGGGKTTVRDLLDAIADEARGRRRYRPGHEPEAAPAEGPEPPPDWQPGTLAPSKPSELMTADDWKDFYQRQRGGDLFAQRVRDLIANMADTAPHQGKVAIGEVYDAYRKAYPRDYQSPATFGHRLVNAAKARNLVLARLDMPERMDADLRQRSETPWGDDAVHFVVKLSPGQELGDLARAPETIAGAAYRINGKVYSAPNHVLAMDAAVKDLGVGGYADLVDIQGGLEQHREGDGFITSAGRFVGRDEARAIAERAGQGKATADRGIKTEDMAQERSQEFFQRERDPQVDTPEFKNWFGGSKVVDEAGNPLVVYHGTKSPDIDAFERGKAGASDPGLVGKAFYFTPTPEQAGDFATSRHYGRGENPNVIPAYVALKNPVEIIDGRLPDGRSLTDLHPQGITKSSGAAIQQELKKAGYDGVIFKIGDEITQVAAFKPEQIKSATGNRGTFDPNDPRILYQREPAPPFYSAVERAVTSAKQDKASPQQWLGMLKNVPGVKAEEMEWLGLEDWLKQQKGPVTKAQIADYVRANQIEVKEVEKGAANVFRDKQGHLWTEEEMRDPAVRALAERRGAERVSTPTKFSQYTLPGGENYRELLLTLPTKERYPAFEEINRRLIAKYGGLSEAFQRWTPEEQEEFDRVHAQEQAAPAAPDNLFRSSHFDEPNILAHVRFDDRTVDGKKTLHVSEIQSDWHQKGKKQGYNVEPPRTTLPDGWKVEKTYLDGVERYAVLDATGDRMGYASTPEEAVQVVLNRYNRAHQQGVPDAPFKTTWPELALKRIIRYAAENGYDKLSWDTGETQAARYDLSKQVEAIVAQREGNNFNIRAIMNGVRSEDLGTHSLEKLPDVVGKDLAEKIAKQDEGILGRKRYEGVDLKVGGEGMKGFYDQILPATVNKLVKKFGGKVGEANLPEGDTGEIYAREGGPFLGNARSRAEIEAARAEGRFIKPDAKAEPVHTLDISDKLRETATEQGFPLFQGVRGKVTFAAGRRPVLTLMREADASTFVHETGHIFLEELMDFADHPAAPDQLKTDAQTALKWLGVESREGIGTRQHEKFARGFEQYMREGVAPSKELASVFARFKDWLLRIYQSIKGLGAPINEDIRQVFDRMLSAEPQRTVIAPERGHARSLADVHEADAAEFSTQEAEAAKARVDTERLRAHSELPPDIAKEHAESDARAAAAQSATETGPGGGGPPAVQPDRGGPAGEPAGGGGGTQPGAQREGVAGAGAEGARPSGEPGPGAAPGREEPRALPLAPGSAAGFERLSLNVGKDGNIRVENLTSVPEFVQAIEDSAKRIGGGGPITMGEMLNLADTVGIDPKEITEAGLARLFNGTQNLSAKVWALRQAVVASSEIVHAAMQNVRDAGSDAAVAEFAKAAARHDMIQSVLSSVTTEIGRGLGMGFRNLEGWQKAQDLNQFLKENTGRTLFQLKMIAKLGAQLDSPAKVSKFLRDAEKRSAGEMLLEYWTNGLISGVSTHVTYFIGNKLLMLQEAVPETLIASAIGSARAAMGREGTYVRPGEALAQVKAIGRNLPKSFQGALEAIRSGQPTLLPGQTARPLTPFQGDTALTVARNITNDPVTWHEVAGDFFGAMKGLRDGLVAGAELVAAGGEAGAPMVGFHYSPLGQIPDVAFRGVPVLPVGSALRVPGRLVAAIHSFDTIANYSRIVAAKAYREGIERGFSGNDLASHIGDRTINPPADWMEDAHKQAYAATLMAPGGNWVQGLSKLINTSVNLPILGKTRPLKFIDPFVHIGANVINKAILERTPIGILSSEIRADLMGKNGNVAQDMAAARMLAGTALSLVFGGLAMEGYASGSGPSDPRQSAMWRLAGNQAHSVRIGDIWYQSNRLGPIGMLMGVAADMYDVAHDAAKGDMFTAAAHLQHAVTQNILDESFMRGPSDLIKAVEDPGRYGEAYLKQFVSSFVPFSVGMAQMARASDPYSRQARTVMDEIRRKVPGMSETLWPRRDIWGEELPNPEALLAAGVTAIWETRMSRDPVNLAMLQLGIAPAAIERKIRNVELTEQQYDDFARVAGRMTKMRLDTIVSSPDWRAWSSHIRADVITETIRQSREAARGQMMQKYPQIPHDAAEFQRKKAMGE